MSLANKKSSVAAMAFCAMSLAGTANATCPDGRAEPCINLSPLTPGLTPNLTPSPGLNLPPAPQIQEIKLAVLPALAAAAAQPATIRAQRVDLVSGQARDLGALVTRLNEVDSELLKYRREVGAESFKNLLESLLAAVERRAPKLSSKLEQSLSNIWALLQERSEINRKIMAIVAPGASMQPGPYIEPTRSGPSDSPYQVYSSNTTTTGAVVAPNPAPACHKEERIHREYRNVQLPNGFDARGTPLYRNVYHPFPVSELVEVCR